MSGATHFFQRWLMFSAVPILLHVFTAVATAQQVTSDGVADRSGIHLSYGLTVSMPILDKGAERPIAALGEVRAGPGVQIGIGYQRRSFNIELVAGLAGLEIGEPIERNGIGMVRETFILRDVAVIGSWKPAATRLGAWYTVISAGIAWASLDNFTIPAEQLPADLRDAAGSDKPSVEGLAGIGGSGFRFGIQPERSFSPSLALRLGLTIDAVDFRTFTFDGARAPRGRRWRMGPAILHAPDWSP